MIIFDIFNPKTESYELAEIYFNDEDEIEAKFSDGTVIKSPSLPADIAASLIHERTRNA